MKIYELYSERQNIIISIVKESSKGKINTIRELEKVKSKVDALYKKRIKFWSHPTFYTFIVSIVAFVFLLNILKDPIGGWRWPASIIRSLDRYYVS